MRHMSRFFVLIITWLPMYSTATPLPTCPASIVHPSTGNLHALLPTGDYLLTRFLYALNNTQNYQKAVSVVNDVQDIIFVVREHREVGVVSREIVIGNFHEGDGFPLNSNGMFDSIPSHQTPEELGVSVKIVGDCEVEVSFGRVKKQKYRYVGNAERYFTSLLFKGVYADVQKRIYMIFSETAILPNGEIFATNFGSDVVGDGFYWTGDLMLSQEENGKGSLFIVRRVDEKQMLLYEYDQNKWRKNGGYSKQPVQTLERVDSATH